MERVLPIDLDHAKLSRGFRGYDVAATDRLIQSASRSIETLILENASLKQQIESQSGEIETYKTMENTLRDSIILAQRAADDTRSTAHRHADVILEEARLSAQTEKAQLQLKIDSLNSEVEHLKHVRDRFTDDFRALLDRYRRDVEPVRLAVVDNESAAVNA